MKKQFTNKFNSYQNVTAALEKFKNSYEGIPVLKQSAGEFIDLFESIKDQIKKVDLDFSEIADEKAAVKKQLAEVASGLASAGMAYAYDSEDPELKSFLDFSRSDIQYARDAETVEITRHIAEELMGHREELANYMVTEEELETLKAMISKFEKLQKMRESSQSESVIETQRLDVLFNLSDTLLTEKIDRLVRKMMLTDREFYNQYFQARKISDL